MMKLIVDAITNETAEIRSFRLISPDGGVLPCYEPGAHIDVTGPTGVMRQYSLCGPLDDTGAYTFAVKKELASRGGSLALHDAVNVGSMLDIGLPRNLFALDPAAPAHVLFGAGIGVTPLLSMAYRLSAQQADFALHYFTRSPEHTAFAALIAASPFADKVHIHYGISAEQMPEYLSNYLTTANAAAHVYTCGPAPFMEMIVASAAKTRPEDNIHLEHFKAEATSEAAESGAFEIQLASSGQRLTVPATIPIVDILAQAGIHIDTSCREGICGTCVIPLLEGEPDHRDNCLSKKEKAANDQICTCVSRAKSRLLVLDL
jgi:ferredoxin-NADP reductase